ncbi:MAG: hypothetical protein ACYDB3_08370, partial [Acidimicrobiales bacterium]
MNAALLDLSPRHLRELAALLEARDPELAARRRLSAAGSERLADILLAGDRPTVGFYLRYCERRIGELVREQGRGPGRPKAGESAPTGADFSGGHERADVHA